ncbi:MAG: PA2778 family cysteine peptidase, partial [Gammaproteobacteria bacterium]|nr:PA2778 family cysteine peptidase [Gammaproteobacteria bacterium]
MPAFARRKFTTLFCACLMAGLNFLSGCSNTPLTDQLLKQPPADLSVRRDLQSVPFFPQDAYQCGPAALATLLRHRDIQTEPDKLTDRVYLPARRGSLQVEMIATARSFGLLTYPLKPDLYQVLKEVDAGNPVLVFQNLSLPFWPQWHYAVVAGYDLPQRELILRSGTIARHRIS